MSAVTIVQPPVHWFQVATAISASTTPPADAVIAKNADTSDTAGIEIPPWGSRGAVGQQMLVRAVLATSGGSPSMTVAVYGFTRTFIAQNGTTQTQAGAGSAGEGRWIHLGWLNSGNAITTAAHPECVPASGILDWIEPLPNTGAAFERIHVQLWAAAGTGAVLTTYLGVSGAV